MADTKLFKTLYQILTWTSFVGLIVVIILVLRTSPAPQIPTNPDAAASAEKNFEAADRAKAAGQPSEVALDRTELNSYLAQNLQLEGAPAASAGAAPGSVSGSPAGTATPSSSAGTSGSDPAAVLSSNEQPTIDQVQLEVA